MTEIIDFYPTSDSGESDTPARITRDRACQAGGWALGFDKAKLPEMITPIEDDSIENDSGVSIQRAATAGDIFWLDRGQPEHQYRQLL